MQYIRKEIAKKAVSTYKMLSGKVRTFYSWVFHDNEPYNSLLMHEELLLNMQYEPFLEDLIDSLCIASAVGCQVSIEQLQGETEDGCAGILSYYYEGRLIHREYLMLQEECAGKKRVVSHTTGLPVCLKQENVSCIQIQEVP